jgi:CRISPR-associated endonuclease Cas2
MTTSHTNGNKASYIVSYDFTSNKLRRRIDKMLKNYGTRLQCSVFSCNLTAVQVEELTEKLKALINKFREFHKPCDSLVVIGGLTSGNLNFIVGEECNLKDFMVY